MPVPTAARTRLSDYGAWRLHMSDFSINNSGKVLTAIMALLLVGSVPSLLMAADWPAFRGENGLGIAAEGEYPTEWSSSQNIRWRVPLPGPDNGSPIVVGGKVLVLSAQNEGRERSTLCFDRSTGKLLWQQKVEFDKVEATHQTNPYCPETPVSDGETVFVWHRSAGMHAYDLEGNRRWTRELGEFHHIWGGGSSPVLYRNLVIQLCGPGERTFLIALNKETGETVWQSETEPGGSAGEQGRYVGSWATPVITQIDGEDRLLCPFPTRLAIVDPATGKELASCVGLAREKSDLCYTSPMVGDGHAVILGGFQGPGFGLKLGGAGDITDSHRLWRTRDDGNPQRIGSGVILDGYLYQANADGPGSIECLDIHTGEQQWKLPRSENGAHWGSVVFANGLLYATGQRGTTTVFKPNPQQFEPVSINRLGEQTNSTPAFSNGEIFLRTWEALYCIAPAE